MSFDNITSERAVFGITMVSKDVREGTSAFLKKRKPVFKGELN